MDFALAKRARRAESPFFAGKIDDVLFKRREPVIHTFSPCLSPPRGIALDADSALIYTVFTNGLIELLADNP